MNSAVERPRGRRSALVAACVIACAAVVWACSAGGTSGGGSASGATRPARLSSLVAADALANTRIGGPFRTALAYRFRARWTGTLSGVRFYVITNPSDRNGYSGGTGGSVRVTLARDSGGDRHVPSGRPLASATLRTPNQSGFPQVVFSQPARVVAGRLYHVMFTNPDPNPTRNYVSVNALIQRDHGRLRRAIPGGYAVSLSRTRDGDSLPTRWFPRSEERGERYIPILDVVGDGGRHSGIGYMEVWVGNPKPIGGGVGVRQLFTAPSGRRITGAWLRVRRTERTSEPLKLRIERADGSALAEASVAPRSVPSSGPGWVRVRFDRPVSAPPGSLIALAAASSGGRAYNAFPIRKGTEFGFDGATVFDGGYAQFSDSGGWVGWDQWDAHDRRDGDLQFSIVTARGS